ncbi:shikimate kinase [Methanomassiliicoccus luminyensis]|jgi:shikimate kinase|uniref:shikimate kinase n=1 Tax=Methanomassiliicoccus luminyensis TaxID=1080712 RepID=UPI00037D1224|nr:shikimate kinase [Methanomassiliicoccus luminyensis]
MRGSGTSHGAATIVNAIANGKGAAFGIDLRTVAEVELTEGYGVEVVMDGFPGEDPGLAERCVRAVLDRHAPGERYHARVRTSSQIPISRGLKSSSAAANAIIKAAVDALGLADEPLDLVRMGTRAAIEAGVSVTGAFDDACASMLGGIVMTDNRSETLLARDIMPDHLKVVIDIPDLQIRKGSLPLDRIRAVSGITDLAFRRALEGDYHLALTLNGMCYSAAAGLDQEVAMAALQSGALSAGVTGTGPATVMLVEEDKVRDFLSAMKGRQLAVVDIYNGEGNK